MPSRYELVDGPLSETLLRFDVRTTVFDQGEPNTAWYEVISGTVRLCRYLEDGSRQILQFAFEGDILGSSGELYSASAEPIEPVVLRRHRIAAIDRDRALTPGARVQAGLEQSLALLRLPSATARVAAFLDMLASRIGQKDVVDLPMSRTDIADHLGLTPSTVSRSLGTLIRQGVLETDGVHRLRLTDRTRLALLGGLEDPFPASCDRFFDRSTPAVEALS